MTIFFLGREFFVGISDTSNEAGASAVAEAFPEFPCTPIKVISLYGLRSLEILVLILNDPYELMTF